MNWRGVGQTGGKQLKQVEERSDEGLEFDLLHGGRMLEKGLQSSGLQGLVLLARQGHLYRALRLFESSNLHLQ